MEGGREKLSVNEKPHLTMRSGGKCQLWKHSWESQHIMQEKNDE